MRYLGDGADRDLVFSYTQLVANRLSQAESVQIDNVVKHCRLRRNPGNMPRMCHLKRRAKQNLGCREANEILRQNIDHIMNVQNDRDLQHPGSQDHVRIPRKAVCVQQMDVTLFQQVSLAADSRYRLQRMTKTDV